MKAVIPVAGLGTRLLPATKAMPKEMISVVDKPAIQYVVEEAVGAGIEHVLMVTGRNKAVIEDHFDRAIEIEATLVAKGDYAKLQAVTEVTDLADIHYVRQGNPMGLGHAVAQASAFVGEAPFALLLGDVILEHSELLSTMMALAKQEGVNVVALAEVAESVIESYGIAEIGETSQEGFVQIKQLVEKPSRENAPSRFAVMGRYVLQPGIFQLLEEQSAGVGGEIQLTDVLNKMAQNPEIAGPVVGVVFRGDYFDVGDRLSLLKSNVLLGLKREDIGDDFRRWLAEIR